MDYIYCLPWGYVTHAFLLFTEKKFNTPLNSLQISIIGTYYYYLNTIILRFPRTPF